MSLTKHVIKMMHCKQSVWIKVNALEEILKSLRVIFLNRISLNGLYLLFINRFMFSSFISYQFQYRSSEKDTIYIIHQVFERHQDSSFNNHRVMKYAYDVVDSLLDTNGMYTITI